MSAIVFCDPCRALRNAYDKARRSGRPATMTPCADCRWKRGLIDNPLPDGCPMDGSESYGKAGCKCSGHIQRRQEAARKAGLSGGHYSADGPADQFESELLADGEIDPKNVRRQERRLAVDILIRRKHLSIARIAQRAGVSVKTVERRRKALGVDLRVIHDQAARRARVEKAWKESDQTRSVASRIALVEKVSFQTIGYDLRAMGYRIPRAPRTYRGRRP